MRLFDAWRFRIRGLFFLAPLVGAAQIFAGPLTVSSYTINTPTEISYPDDTGTQLTDGFFGSTNIFSAPAAVPWVGWMGANAISMTFNFATPETINSVSIDFLNETSQTFVFLPDSVLIGGHVFPVASNAIPNPSTGFITFVLPTSLTTSSIQIELDKAGSGGFHELIDEVTFDGTTPASGVPEPATLPVIGGALLALAAAGKRLKK
jgi:hypothetical protein